MISQRSLTLILGLVAASGCGSAYEGGEPLAEEASANETVGNPAQLVETEMGESVRLSELSEQDLPLNLADGYTICALSDQVVFGRSVRRSEQFNFQKLNDSLATLDGLTDAVGLSEITDCSDARAVVKAINELPVPEQISDPSLRQVEPDEAEIGEEFVDKIHVGESVTETTSGRQQQGIVELSSQGCTGFFITGRHILTSAHCVPHSSGTLTLRYRAPGLSSRRERFRFKRHRNYQDGDHSTDIAVLTRADGDLSWANSKRRFRLYTGRTVVNTKLNIYGYGAKYHNGSGSMEGVLRTGKDFARIGIDRHSSGYFTADAYTARHCSGDSGGPAIKQGDDLYNIVWGLNESSNKYFDEQCPTRTYDMRYTKTNTTIDDVEEIIGFRCKRSNANNTKKHGPYAKCW